MLTRAGPVSRVKEGSDCTTKVTLSAVLPGTAAVLVTERITVITWVAKAWFPETGVIRVMPAVRATPFLMVRLEERIGLAVTTAPLLASVPLTRAVKARTPAL